MGKWIHQSHVDETVGWFVRHAMPDAEPGWEDLPWRIEEMGRTDDRGFWWCGHPHICQGHGLLVVVPRG